MVKINCKQCGEEKEVKPYRIKRGLVKFCSIKCKGKAMQGKNNHNWKEKIIIICKYCKKEKEIFPCGTKRGRGKFCNRICRGKWQSENNKGKNNPHWQGGITPERNKEKSKIWRKAVFERDNYRCLICGQVGGCLNAHHIQNWAGHPELRYCVDNGMTMCQDCHKTVDKELPLFSIKNRKRKEIING